MRPRLLQRLDRGLEEVGGRGRQVDGFEIERRQDVAIGGIAGRRERDAVAGIEARQEGERKAARRAGRHDDALGRHLRLVGLAIVPRDALAQRRNAERGDIADAVAVEGGMRRGQRPLGCRRAGLADLEVNDGVARRLLLGGSRHDIHDDERIDRTAAARELARHRSSAGNQRQSGAGRIHGAAAARTAAAQARGADDGVDPAALPAP